MTGKSLTQATIREFKQFVADARETGRLGLIIWRSGGLADSRGGPKFLVPFVDQRTTGGIAVHDDF